jgi:hypothetical protein
MAKNRRICEIRITLNGIKPPIWRRVAVPSDITLGELHEVIQIVMGWMNCHLHQFILRDKNLKPTRREIARQFRQDAWDETFIGRMRGERIFVPCGPEYGDLDMEGEDEDAVTLVEVCPKVKKKLIYEYDFGDGWQHTIEVQKITEPQDGIEYPVCLAGKRACPPEDCGGVWGYHEMLAAVSDPNHEMHEEYAEWLSDDFDPEAFDLDQVNAVLARWRKGRA